MINQEEIKSQDDVVVNQGGRSSEKGLRLGKTIGNKVVDNFIKYAEVICER